MEILRSGGLGKHAQRKSGFAVKFQDLLIEEGWNRRAEDELKIQELKNFLKVHPISDLDPLRGRGVFIQDTEGNEVWKFLVRDGHRRTAAISELITEGFEFKTDLDETGNVLVSVKNISGDSELSDLLIQLTANSGEPLTLRAKAQVVADWVDMWVKEHTIPNLNIYENLEVEAKKDLSALWGVSITHVNDCYTLSQAPEEIKTWLSEGKLSATFALETYRKHGEEAVKLLSEAIEKATSEGKTKATQKHLISPPVHEEPKESKDLEDYKDLEESKDLEGYEESKGLEGPGGPEAPQEPVGGVEDPQIPNDSLSGDSPQIESLPVESSLGEDREDLISLLSNVRWDNYNTKTLRRISKLL